MNLLFLIIKFKIELMPLGNKPLRLLSSEFRGILEALLGSETGTGGFNDPLVFVADKSKREVWSDLTY